VHEPGYLEPWLRGIAAQLHPVTGHLLRASEHIREDGATALQGLGPEQIWAKPQGLTSAGFHAKHLAGSTQRLCTYLEGASLTVAEVAAASLEGSGTESGDELIQAVNRAFERYELLVRALKPEEFGAVREIGRKKLPVTAVSLAIHIAEHGQRHVGQLISAAKLVQALNG
jgi:hypothetical protein